MYIHATDCWVKRHREKLGRSSFHRAHKVSLQENQFHTEVTYNSAFRIQLKASLIILHEIEICTFHTYEADKMSLHMVWSLQRKSSKARKKDFQIKHFCLYLT